MEFNEDHLNSTRYEDHLTTIQYGMDLYQAYAERTALYRKSIEEIDPGVEAPNLRRLLALSYTALGLGEVGELQGKIKKLIRDSGGNITQSKIVEIRKEAGDCLWYLAMLLSELGETSGTAAVENIEKLASRKERGTLHGSGDSR